MKTNPRRRQRINVIEAESLLMERIRASLSRSPFLFLDSAAPLPEEEVELYVAPVETALQMLNPADRTMQGDRLPPLVPVIAWGPAGFMRSAFHLGVSDYLREPWSPEELELRMTRVLRERERRTVFPWGTLVMDGGRVETRKGSAALTVHESRILRTLLLNRGTPVTREALSYRLWNHPLAGGRAIDVHVSALRRKLTPLAPGPIIRSVRREGYIIE